MRPSDTFKSPGPPNQAQGAVPETCSYTLVRHEEGEAARVLVGVEGPGHPGQVAIKGMIAAPFMPMPSRTARPALNLLHPGS